MKTIASISISFFLLLGGCSKTIAPTLPPIAHTGQDMLAFKVNGNVVSVYNSYLSLIDFHIYDSANFVSIYGYTNAPNCGMEIRFQYLNGLGNYPISTIYPYGAYFTDNAKGALTGTNIDDNYNCDSMHTGSINVVYYDSHEMAGYFQFDAISDSGRIVHITDGRFDVYKH